jgi:hypothetical protein
VGGKGVLMKIGRLLIVWFTDKKLMDDVMKLLNGGYHVHKNPVSKERKERMQKKFGKDSLVLDGKEAEGENRMEGR